MSDVQALIDRIERVAKDKGFKEGLNWAKNEEFNRISQRLKNQEAKYRKEGRDDIAALLAELRDWFRRTKRSEASDC